MSTFLLLILNLFILESLLSVDNAAVLAVMVRDLPNNQKTKALRYGLFGAYAFRGACLFVASWLIKIFWLKIVGGLYLLYLVYGHYTKSNDTIEEISEKKDSKIFRFFSSVGLNRFWATVVLVEIMDLAFSLDNIFAAVAFSSNIIAIMIGVGLGILAMRFIAGWFVSIITKYPSLEKSAFVVIAFLGLKLVLSGISEYYPSSFGALLKTHSFDLIFSGAMMVIFFVPLMFTKHQPANIYKKSEAKFQNA